MLKPKRNIVREEIKHDVFMETLASIKDYYDENKKFLLKITSLGGVIILLILFLSSSSNSKNLDANLLLTRAMVSMESKDDQNATILLQELIDIYPSTKSGKKGYYYLGMLEYKNNNTITAKSHLELFVKKGNSYILISAAYSILSEFYLSENNLSKAIENQLKAVSHSGSGESGAMKKLNLARLYVANSKMSEAKKILSDIVSNFKNSPQLVKKIDQINGLIVVKNSM